MRIVAGMERDSGKWRVELWTDSGHLVTRRWYETGEAASAYIRQQNSDAPEH